MGSRQDRVLLYVTRTATALTEDDGLRYGVVWTEYSLNRFTMPLNPLRSVNTKQDALHSAKPPLAYT